MFVVIGLAASVLFPSHAAAISVSSTALSLLRRRRRASKPATSPAAAAVTGDVHIEWENLTLSVPALPRPILRGVSGRALPGRVLAICGPSGSGKTSLLTAIAGRLGAEKGVVLEGAFRVNRVLVGGIGEAAFVPQEDVFFSQLTVRETMELATKMQGEEGGEDIIKGLGLGPCADSRVGSVKVRGISGGEKKRLSLGCELIGSPRCVFADEPLSGVDSFQAERVMGSLRKLAKEDGKTVVFSVHQPSGSILGMCDDLMLLAGGEVVYAGAVGGAKYWFEYLGHKKEENETEAEWFLKLISVDTTSSDTVKESQARIAKMIASNRENMGIRKPADEEEVQGVVSVRDGSGTHLGLFAQLRLLLQRAFRQVTRDKKTNKARIMSSVMSALLFGCIYWKIGYTQSTIQDRLGLLQVCCINSAMSALVKTLQVFGSEREIVSREQARGAYNLFPYFSSKLMAELPISAIFPLAFSAIVYPMCGLSGGLARIARFMGIITLESFTSASYGLFIGSIAPSPEAAVAIGPSSFVLFIVFGGLYVNGDNVPRWLSWVPRISIIKHAFEGLCVNEFRGIQFESKRPWDVLTGEQQLARLGWGESTVTSACLSQARVLAINYLLTYAVLIGKAARYQKVSPADPVVIEDITNEEESSTVASTA